MSSFIDVRVGRDWKKIASAPLDGTKVDLWMEINASPRSFGMSDSFGVPKCWYTSDGKWVHFHNGKVAELERDYITHWRLQRPLR